MPHKYLATYLNDHLAGSALGMELLENIAAAYAGSEVQRLALELHADVAADRRELEGLMDRLQIQRSISRRSSAWVSEKMIQLKLRIDDPGTGAFRLLESIEAVSIGAEGKRLLWLALETVAAGEPALAGMDLPRLVRRAEDQRARLEVARRQAAGAALSAAP